MTAFVIAKDGTRLMPTTNVKKVRRLLKEGKARIEKRRPYFVIRLSYTPEGISDERLELCVDTGSEHIGISLKSAKHEYVSEQRDNLPDEKKMRDSQREARKSRRNRKRHRRCRPFHNNNQEDWFAPSLLHKMENHLNLAREAMAYCPVTDVWLEVGSFDTQALAAIEAGKPLPEGDVYQHGPRYRHDTLREAVFYRDSYKCLVCGRSAIKDHAVLRVHHIGFREHDHSDRMGNLATVCSRCHDQSNHKPGGKLWEFRPALRKLDGAAFMNAARWQLLRDVEKAAGKGVKVHAAYGAATKRARLERNLRKSHANDAYSIGELRPSHRTPTRFYKKARRNNRCLEKFVDAVYVDIRDGVKKPASELGYNRTKRGEPRRNENNARPFRGRKVSAGYRSIRRERYQIRPGDQLVYTRDLSQEALAMEKGARRKAPSDPALYQGKKFRTTGQHNEGKDVTYTGSKRVPMEGITPALDRKGEKIPIAKGNRCVYLGGKKPKRVTLLGVSDTGDAAYIKWQYSVPVRDVRVAWHTGGWIEYFPKEKFIY